MPWLRHLAVFALFLVALFKPTAAGAFSSAPPATAQARVGAFEFVAATLVGPASVASPGLVGAIAAAYDENASGYRFAAEGVARAGGGGTTTLFRAVSEAEYQQLMQTGRFAARPNSLGGKFFAESAADAARWGDVLRGAGNYRIISAELPTSAADQLMRWVRLDGIGPARFGELEQLTEAIIRSVR